jgi:hypothetical protein
VVKVLARVVLSVIERFFATTFKVSPSLLSAVSLVVVVSSVSQLVSIPSSMLTLPVDIYVDTSLACVFGSFFTNNVLQ